MLIKPTNHEREALKLFEAAITLVAYTGVYSQESCQGCLDWLKVEYLKTNDIDESTFLESIIDAMETYMGTLEDK